MLPTVFIYCCSKVKDYLDKKQPYKGKIQYKVVLEKYTDLTRQQMERLPSTKGLSNLFHDFTQEKCDLMEWALQSLPDDQKEKGVLFCDADICWLGPLPDLTVGKTLGLSPHMIRHEDSLLYGTYNAGFIWTNQDQMPLRWRNACKTSRFFEQAALEDLEDSTPENEVYIFGQEYNYGWWRMFQSSNPYEVQQKAWKIHRDTNQSHSGLCVNEVPVRCIHTHWKTKDHTTNQFNIWILDKLTLLKKQSNIRSLVEILTKNT